MADLVDSLDPFSSVNPIGRRGRDVLNWMHELVSEYDRIREPLSALLVKTEIPPLGEEGSTVGLLEGRITAVSGNGTASTYDVVSVDGTVSLQGETPLLRPFAALDIIKANVNDPCTIIHKYNASDQTYTYKLWQVPEVIDPGDCATPPGMTNKPAGGSGAPSSGPIVATSMPVGVAQQNESVMDSYGYSLAEQLDYFLSRISLLGTMSTQASSNVTITGGSITGITDLAVADGGTGSSTAAGARSNLGAQGIPIIARRITTAATGASFQTLFSVSIPGGTLGTTGGVCFEFYWRRTTGSGNGTFRLVYGSTTMITFTATSSASGFVKGVLAGDGATSAQRAHAVVERASADNTGTAAEDSTGALNLIVQVDLATDADVFTADWEFVMGYSV